jgi:hypothetical protein
VIAVGREEGDPPLDGKDRVGPRSRREGLGRPGREDCDQADESAPRGDPSFGTATIHGCPTVRRAYVEFVKTAPRLERRPERLDDPLLVLGLDLREERQRERPGACVLRDREHALAEAVLLSHERL